MEKKETGHERQAEQGSKTRGGDGTTVVNQTAYTSKRPKDRNNLSLFRFVVQNCGHIY
jgi:hypothetical protein